MFKSPNDMLFESKQGQGSFLFKGRIKGERIEATSLSAPELDSIASQIEEIRTRIRALSVQQPPASAGGAVHSQSAPPADDVLAHIQEVREELRSANLPGLLAQMDEIRATRSSTGSQLSVQQITKLQDQVTRLVGQMNTLQDRVSILEGHVRQASSSSAPAPTTTVADVVSDVASAAVGAAASAVVNRAAMKLEDMVSPGALYNLRRVSDRGPVKYAW